MTAAHLIEYYYSAHSAFAYLGSQKLYQLCADHGCTLVHKPISLGPVVAAAGGQPFAGRTQAHVDYFFGREIERWAEIRAVPVIRFRPTHHDAPYDLASGMILACGATGDRPDRLAHAILQAHWRDDADLSDPVVLTGLARALDLDAPALLAVARSGDIQARYAANTAEAIRRGIFGSPTYVVDGDPFYGQDRLELVERALTRPFEPNAWGNPPVG